MAINAEEMKSLIYGSKRIDYKNDEAHVYDKFKDSTSPILYSTTSFERAVYWIDHVSEVIHFELLHGLAIQDMEEFFQLDD